MAQGVPGPSFNARDLSKERPTFSLPDQPWVSMLEVGCTFNADVFRRVMFNLIKNPNINSSHLFRADIFYDSETQGATDDGGADFIRQMKVEYKPLTLQIGGYAVERTIVRQMIPRNPQLDKPMVQTCHLYHSIDDGEGAEKTLVIYLPHVSDPEEMPWYHPTVRYLAFLHTASLTSNDHYQVSGTRATISVHFCLFPDHPLEYSPRLTRTASNLLSTLFKHGQGAIAGYTKRVHHDQIISQKLFQDTYTLLKQKYAKRLVEEWAEQTDPTKHVFEDLGIAAFLIELWKETYDTGDYTPDPIEQSNIALSPPDTGERRSQGRFPGFVDIGCGNGVLVYVLVSEGYPGWGFDARRRKTWASFAPEIQARLQEMLLVPKVLARNVPLGQFSFHDGTFPIGTFIISNHADELTAWTPLLAYLCTSSFLAIPCCSHNLAGARFRAPAADKSAGEKRAKSTPIKTVLQLDPERDEEQPKSGSLHRPERPPAMSAYATLCAYVERLTGDLGFDLEKEMLRIPSTRNAAIIGRWSKGNDNLTQTEKESKICRLVSNELRRPVDDVGHDWIDNATKIVNSYKRFH